MELKQKYTEDSAKFELDLGFIEDIMNFDIDVRNKISDIIDTISDVEDTLEPSYKTGYVNSDKGEVFYFSLSYIKETNEPMFLISIKEINSDQYLDSINLKFNII